MDHLYSPALQVVERDLTLLVRQLEALSRQRQYPLERAYYLVLCTLAERGPMALGTLAEALILDNSTVTRQIAAMQRKKLVTRKRSASDARSFEIEATPLGSALASDMREQRLARMAPMLGDWDHQDMLQLQRQLDLLNKAIRQQIMDTQP